MSFAGNWNAGPQSLCRRLSSACVLVNALSTLHPRASQQRPAVVENRVRTVAALDRERRASRASMSVSASSAGDRTLPNATAGGHSSHFPWVGPRFVHRNRLPAPGKVAARQRRADPAVELNTDPPHRGVWPGPALTSARWVTGTVAAWRHLGRLRRQRSREPRPFSQSRDIVVPPFGGYEGTSD
ncbi:hypothetical protein VFPFJ_07211 [Purpureocillium lilacinum]|uniref:Uncharacterized protein n=1 Tax=Purpureocillium lilacinum TaxID=33203 RepID=A0A179HEE4_PURLI|nr:hypothetical protein VFPFJ_07211 [Purpureocillium lilacinum]OAQ88746.1 hypothetical protein VFPFJ_07211 [Purpureocillium lilacinum]